MKIEQRLPFLNYRPVTIESKQGHNITLLWLSWFDLVQVHPQLWYYPKRLQWKI